MTTTTQQSVGTIKVRAGENLPARHVVYIGLDGAARVADGSPAQVGVNSPVGLVLQDAAINSTVEIFLFGRVQSDAWSWAGALGKSLYLGAAGQLVTERPAGLIAYRCGTVLDSQTVLFLLETEVQPLVYQTSPASLLISGQEPVHVANTTNLVGEHVVTVSVTPATNTRCGLMSAQHVTSLATLEVAAGEVATTLERLDTTKSNAHHTHELAEVIGLNRAIANKADAAHRHTEYAFSSHQHPGIYAPLVHSHAISDVLNLTTALANKADRAHSNTFDEIFESVDRSGDQEVRNEPSLRGALALKLSTTGGTMTGNLTLAGNPTSALHAATKQYVDQSLNQGTGALTHVDVSGAAVNDVLTFTGAGWNAVPPLLPLPRIKTVTAQAYSPVVADADGHTLIRMNSNAPAVFRIPGDSTYNHQLGATFVVTQAGVGQVTITAPSGVRLNSPGTLLISNQFGRVSITKVGPNEWDLSGNLKSIA